MIYIALVLMCVLVIEASNGLRIMSHIRSIISHSKYAIACIMDKNLSDREKEKTARASSQAILKDTFLFVGKFGIAASMILLPYFLLFQFTGISFSNFTSFIMSWSVIVALTLFSIAYIKIRYGHCK